MTQLCSDTLIHALANVTEFSGSTMQLQRDTSSKIHIFFNMLIQMCLSLDGSYTPPLRPLLETITAAVPLGPF